MYTHRHTHTHSDTHLHPHTHPDTHTHRHTSMTMSLDDAADLDMLSLPSPAQVLSWQKMFLKIDNKKVINLAVFKFKSFILRRNFKLESFLTMVIPHHILGNVKSKLGLTNESGFCLRSFKNFMLLFFKQSKERTCWESDIGPQEFLVAPDSYLKESKVC